MQRYKSLQDLADAPCRGFTLSSSSLTPLQVRAIKNSTAGAALPQSSATRRRILCLMSQGKSRKLVLRAASALSSLRLTLRW